MKTISGKQLREEWKKFWESKQHVLLPEASLIPTKGESTAMFTIAGMQQLIPYLSGQAHPLGKRLFNIQKCIRTVDIDEVGDASHLTFFEMMGNRSLGEYFKKEAVQRSWEFLVNVLGFDPKKLAATVFEGDRETEGDTETIGYWKGVGLDEERICTMSAKDNRRSPGPVGPCGPCTEIYYRVGTAKLPPKGSTPKTDEKNWLEIRNNVFMEYYRSRRTIIADATHCVFDEEGNIFDKQLVADLDLLEKGGCKIILTTNVSDIKKFTGLPFAVDIFTLNKNPAKDHPDFFHKLLEKYALSPDDVLVFDHKEAHVAAAKQAGISLSHYYEGYDSVKDFIDDNKYLLKKLPQKNVDTGMGFERMCTVLQQKESVYETDVFASLLQIITDYVGLPYAGNERRYRIIADHLRTSFFLIRDGVIPSNEGRGYVLRRLIRRTHYNMILLMDSLHKKNINIYNSFDRLIKPLVKSISEHFSLDLSEKTLEHIAIKISQEILQFQKTIENGYKLLQDIIKSAKKKMISGADAFKLYDTFGFPIELTKEIAMEAKFTVDEQGFEQEMQAQQQRSRAGSKNMFSQDVDRSKYIIDLPPTKFVGYETMKADKITLLKDFEVGGQRILIFDQTPLYAESGGQVSDTGTIVLDTGEHLHIKEVKKYEGVYLHFVA